MADDETKCQGMNCHGQGNAAEKPHTCPYQYEINDDSTTLCNCCPDCAQECAWAI